MGQKRMPGPGRPSKGDRELFATRIPTAVAGDLRALADDLDLSYSETLAELTRIGLEHRDEFRVPASAAQEALPLKAS